MSPTEIVSGRFVKPPRNDDSRRGLVVFFVERFQIAVFVGGVETLKLLGRFFAEDRIAVLLLEEIIELAGLIDLAETLAGFRRSDKDLLMQERLIGAFVYQLLVDPGRFLDVFQRRHSRGPEAAQVAESIVQIAARFLKPGEPAGRVPLHVLVVGEAFKLLRRRQAVPF